MLKDSVREYEQKNEVTHINKADITQLPSLSHSATCRGFLAEKNTSRQFLRRLFKGQTGEYPPTICDLFMGFILTVVLFETG